MAFYRPNTIRLEDIEFSEKKKKDRNCNIGLDNNIIINYPCFGREIMISIKWRSISGKNATTNIVYLLYCTYNVEL